MSVLITHVFEAPRDVVWAAWTDPDQVARWSGPEGFEVPREPVAIDLRVGGRYELTMVGRADGSHSPTRSSSSTRPRLLVLRCEPIPGVGIHEEAGWHSAFAELAALL